MCGSYKNLVTDAGQGVPNLVFQRKFYNIYFSAYFVSHHATIILRNFLFCLTRVLFEFPLVAERRRFDLVYP